MNRRRRRLAKRRCLVAWLRHEARQHFYPARRPFLVRLRRMGAVI